jgi:transcriptional regulator with XRE-family HTH domain
MASFGQYIAGRRKALKLSQKDVAVRILKEDGTPISAQYLNDVEHDRRKAPPDRILSQLGKELGIPLDVLYFQAERLPPDIKRETASEEQVQAAYKAFRRELKGGGGKQRP